MNLKYQLHSNQLIYLGIFITGMVWAAVNLISAGNTPTVCLLKNVTGIPCPTCGITDSVVHLLNGNVNAAFASNALGIPFAIMLLALSVTASVKLFIKNHTVLQLISSYEKWINNHLAFVVFGVLLVLVNWLWILFRFF
jgi:Protein of unknown function (DUF2752)